MGYWNAARFSQLFINTISASLLGYSSIKTVASLSVFSNEINHNWFFQWSAQWKFYFYDGCHRCVVLGLLSPHTRISITCGVQARCAIFWATFTRRWRGPPAKLLRCLPVTVESFAYCLIDFCLRAVPSGLRSHYKTWRLCCAPWLLNANSIVV